MPIENLVQGAFSYHLLCFDEECNERTDDPDGMMSQRVLGTLQSEPVTDIFLFSHGWLGDIPAARAQYTKWIQAMAANTDDIRRMSQLQPGFYPLLVGLHWPSLPLGNEEFVPGTSFSAPLAGADSLLTPAASNDAWVRDCVRNLGGTPAATQAVRTILEAIEHDPQPSEMPADVIQAYEVLDRECDLESGGLGAAPDADRAPFDPDAIYQAVRNETEDSDKDFPSIAFGGVRTGDLMAPLRSLSFWRMKARARRFGSTAGFQLLQKMQQAAGPHVRFHLMGHSFGCIVASAILLGPDPLSTRLMRPVDSLSLLQGALSLWSYAADIPYAPGTPGYFHHIVADRLVAGPIVTTQSSHDTAVGRLYPLAAGLARHVAFALDEFPKYGALGAYGAQGLGSVAVELTLPPKDQDCGFEAGRLYNLECSHIIRHGNPPSGAHSDLAHPEVAHAIWQAAITGLT